MTKEEAIRIAQGLISDFKCDSDIMVDFCNTVIKALEQEPKGINFWDLDDNDDCISRKAVLSILADHFDNPFDRVRELPSVNIPNKTGRWIRQKSLYGYSNTYECPICGRTIYANDQEDLEDYPYCHCGAKMNGE